jgi:hypothetical protein
MTGSDQGQTRVRPAFASRLRRGKLGSEPLGFGAYIRLTSIASMARFPPGRRDFLRFAGLAVDATAAHTVLSAAGLQTQELLGPALFLARSSQVPGQAAGR